MPFNQRLKIFEAIHGSAIHQSLATASSQVGLKPKLLKPQHFSNACFRILI
jgi:hypothetical protein